MKFEEKYKPRTVCRTNGSYDEYERIINYFCGLPEDGEFKLMYKRGGEGTRIKKNALKSDSMKKDWSNGDLEAITFIPKK